MTLSGKDVILFVENEAVAYSTECELSVKVEVIDAALGGWSNSVQRRLSWSVKGEFLVPAVAPSSSLLTVMLNKQRLRVMLSTVTAHPQEILPTEYVADNRRRFSGYGYITNLRVSANNGDKAVCSIEITGDGQLTTE